MNTKQLRNTLLLMGCSFIWGTAFVAQSVGGGYMGAYTFLAGRSWLACVFLLGLMGARRANQRRKGVRVPFFLQRKTLAVGGLCCGTALFAASAVQQMGIPGTTTAKAGFLTALYVVLVPVCGIFVGRRPDAKLCCCVAASVAGLYLLCLAGHDTLSLSGSEWLLLLGALLFTGQILLVNHFSPKLDGIQLSFAQFFVVSVLSTVGMFLFEQPGLHPADRGAEGSGPHHCKPCHVPGKRVQRTGRLADLAPDADPHRADRLRVDVCRHRCQPAAVKKARRNGCAGISACFAAG